MPFTKPGASAPQNALVVSTASSIAPSGGIGWSASTEVGVQHLEQGGSEDGLFERGDPVDRPALGVAGDVLVELVRVVGGGVGERSGERAVAGLEHLVERPAREVVLVQGEDRRAALLGPAHGRLRVAQAAAVAGRVRARAGRATRE